jgi:Domain of unknown function (DUF222)
VAAAGMTYESRADEDLLVGPGDWLADRRSILDRGELGWLETLVQFDLDQLWAADGQLTCVAWLMWRMEMSRTMAYEKWRMAHALRRRPVVAEAFASGDICFSAARAIARLDDPDPEIDEALVELAIHGGVRDLERAVRYCKLCAEQDRLPDPDYLQRRGGRIWRAGDGLDRAEFVLEESELDELEAALRAFDRRQPAAPVDESLRGDAADATPAPHPAVEPVDESLRGDAADPAPAPDDLAGVPLVTPVPPYQRRANALMDLVRMALAHIGAVGGSWPERPLRREPHQPRPGCQRARSGWCNPGAHRSSG